MLTALLDVISHLRCPMIFKRSGTTPALTSRAIRWCRSLLWIPTLALVVSCGDLTGASVLPAGTQDPAVYNSEAGALGLYHGTVTLFAQTFASVIGESGLVTDELRSLTHASGIGMSGLEGLDARAFNFAPGTEGSGLSDYAYRGLQSVRNQGANTIAMLQKYAPSTPPALRGELYAIQGYTLIYLADLYCSGVPLSTVDFEQDFTYVPGSSTTTLYERAIALFDTAITLSADSARVVGLARIGKGRALLSLGQYEAAAQAVADVPSGMQYALQESWVTTGIGVANQKGLNGLPYVSQDDPRTAADSVGVDLGMPKWQPRKYPFQSPAPFIVANWVEARLIVAEALLQANDTVAWLDSLNALRQTAITPALPPLTDPAQASLPEGKTAWDVRVDLMFRERAAWLFLTGHRQGDLRRLIRSYQRTVDESYPTGEFKSGVLYGPDVTMPIPADEDNNPYYKGCLSHDA